MKILSHFAFAVVALYFYIIKNIIIGKVYLNKSARFGLCDF